MSNKASIPKPLPKPNAIAPMSGETNWTAEKVKAIFCNPLYIGHPLSEEEWVRQAAKMIKEDGREQFLVNMLAVMRQTGLLVEPPVVRQDEGSTPYGFSESRKESFPGLGLN
jgi:hypothetical protein